MFRLMISVFLSISINYVFASDILDIRCENQDPTIQRMMNYMAKKDLKSFLLSRLKEKNIQVLEDSIEFDIQNDQTQFPFNGTHYFTTILSKRGSQIMLRNRHSTQDQFGNQTHYGLAPEYYAIEHFQRDDEGIPISRRCYIAPSFSSSSYQIINQSYDDFPIDFDYEEIFNSTYSYELPL